MNFLEVGVKLKAENIQSFIDDFLKVDGLFISDIELKENLILLNKIKYKFFVPISVGIEVSRIEDGVLSIIIKQVKAISIPISIVPINFILKIILNKINMSWIICDGKQIKIDLKEIFDEFKLNFLALDIKDIKITEENVIIMIDNVDLNMSSLLKSYDISDEKDEMVDVKSENEKLNIQTEPDKSEEIYFHCNDAYTFNEEDGFNKSDRTYFNEYSRVRKNIYTENFKKVNRELIGKILFLLPDIGVLCYRLLRDKRIKKSLKILVMFTFMYLINPANFNKKFSILNKIDDAILLVFTLNKIFTSINREILEYHFDGERDTLEFLIETFDVLNQFLGGANINRLYTVFEKFTK